MTRHAILLLSCAALLTPTIGMAQDKPISVYFRPGNVQQINDAITVALSQPPFLLATTVRPDTLVVSIPDKVEVEHGRVSGSTWTFNAVFSRGGDSKGYSQESCNEQELEACTDQLLLDIRSAAGAKP
jgi:hypothetical protein